MNQFLHKDYTFLENQLSIKYNARSFERLFFNEMIHILWIVNIKIAIITSFVI